jgi:hypothetical protein
MAMKLLCVSRLTLVLTFVCTLAAAASAPPAVAAPAATCTPGYHAEYVTQIPAGQIQTTPNALTFVTIQLRNLGCNTWTKNTGSEARLGTVDPEPGFDRDTPLCGTSGWVNCHRIQQTTAAVAYNAVGDFTFDLRAPMNEGIYTLYVQPLVDGVAWMEALGIWVQMRVGGYFGVQNTAFKRPNGTDLMTQQATCIYCVPAATAGWISYVWQKETGSDTGFNFTHADLWNGQFNTRIHSYTGYNQSQNTVACPPGTGPGQGGTIVYNRRLSNTSLDDGVDPYGAAYGIFDNTPGAHYYHVNVYTDGANALGYDFATRAIGLAVSQYNEPTGVLVGNGGHYVLATGVIANIDPKVNFWGTTITKVYIRDPWVPQAQQLQAFATGLPSAWSNTFTRYGYGNGAPQNPPICPNCVDEAHGFGGFTPAWWGAFVNVERNPQTSNPESLLRWSN